MGTSSPDARLLAAARAVLQLQLDRNLRNVDRNALGRALAQLQEAVSRHDQTVVAEDVLHVPSVESVWTRLSGE